MIPVASGVELAPGLFHYPGYLDEMAQARLWSELAQVLCVSPPYTPRMPRTGVPFSVRMTNCGDLGWVSDAAGYRYQARHPETAMPWPAIPPTALTAWTDLAGYSARPEACLVNLYAPQARMGLHQDRDEAALDAPVVSLSLGATALFRYGGLRRGDATRSIRLHSGDAVVIGGASRMIHHGVDRILARVPDLLGADGPPAIPACIADVLAPGGRCNLTLRRVTQPARPGDA